MYVLVDEPIIGSLVYCAVCDDFYQVIDDRVPGFSSIEECRCPKCDKVLGNAHNDMGRMEVRHIKARKVTKEEYDQSDMGEL